MSSILQLQPLNHVSSSTVPKEHRARQLLQLGGGRVHAADSVLRGPTEAGMPRSGDLEALHEEVCQDGGQGFDDLRRRPQDGLPQSRQG